MFVCNHGASVSVEFPLLRLPHSSGPRFERADINLNLWILARNYTSKNPRSAMGQKIESHPLSMALTIWTTYPLLI
jgi:hypothetical protein